VPVRAEAPARPLAAGGRGAGSGARGDGRGTPVRPRLPRAEPAARPGLAGSRAGSGRQRWRRGAGVRLPPFWCRYRESPASLTLAGSPAVPGACAHAGSRSVEAAGRGAGSAHESPGPPVLGVSSPPAGVGAAGGFPCSGERGGSAQGPLSPPPGGLAPAPLPFTGDEATGWRFCHAVPGCTGCSTLAEAPTARPPGTRRPGDSPRPVPTEGTEGDPPPR